MKAIVLTCDRYNRLTDHMIRTYECSWPSNPFTFRVPYQQFPEALKHRYEAKVEPVPAPEDIKNTVLALLDDLPDDEWIYWCIDDKYPIRIDEAAANNTYEWVKGVTDPSVVSVSFCRCRGSAEAENLFPGGAIVNPLGQRFLQKRAPFEFWIPHFIRAGVLRGIFRGFPDEPFAAKQMDYFMMALIYSRRVATPEEQQRLRERERWLVLEKNAAVFGESTTHGELTANCAASFREFGLDLPPGFAVGESEVLMGELER